MEIEYVTEADLIKERIEKVQSLIDSGETPHQLNYYDEPLYMLGPFGDVRLKTEKTKLVLDEEYNSERERIQKEHFERISNFTFDNLNFPIIKITGCTLASSIKSVVPKQR
jgi:hypothetical protein